MRYIFLLFIISTIAFLSACQKSSTTTLSTRSTPPANAAQNTPDPAADVPRITAADAKKDFDAETAVFVDTRSEYAFNIEHVKGAISVPLEKFEERYKDIPTGKKIIAYCD
jgi:3-mercaptopyruvate sulfurtransferase SseA